MTMLHRRPSGTASVFLVCALATSLGLVQLSSSASTPNKLLLLLIDGVRWDYVDNLSGFTRLRQNGVAAAALVPVFPTLSFVNYYAIMTGNTWF